MVLQGWNLRCSLEPGSGSAVDYDRGRQHDRLLPPIRCQGPQQLPPRRRDYIDIDGELYEFLVDTVTQTTSASALYEQIISDIQDRAISWTRLRRTLQFFIDHLGPDDEEVLQIDHALIKEILYKVDESTTWPFLHDPLENHHSARDIPALEAPCAHLTAA